MQKELFGTTKEGVDIYLYTLVNQNGMTVKLINYGAIIVALQVPDVNGITRDVVLGYDTLAEYEVNDCFFGAAVGPNANRIENGLFVINEQMYQLDINENNNNLHSHMDFGFHKSVWEVTEGENEIKLSLLCEDGALGFPGNRTFHITYVLREDNELEIIYEGSSDANTVMNLTNHTYFNLVGEGDVLDHTLKLNAHFYTPVREDCIPTGIIESVHDTPLSFLEPKKVGLEIESDHPQMQIVKGYDHNFMIDGDKNSLKCAGYLWEDTTGIEMRVLTEETGVQLYTGNFISEQMGKKGASYKRRSGLCLETQAPPNAANEASFPNVIYGPERPYQSTTIYQFSVRS